MRKTSLHLASYFTVNGKSGDQRITEAQLVIFSSLIFRWQNRVIIICPTQYGKTLWTALACIIISCIQGKRVAIVAPSNDKAKLTMRYYIEHLGDNPLFTAQLEKNTRLERLKQEESKERIILRNGGGIFVLSAQQRNATKSIEAAMGEGADIVILDESCLVQDDTEATIFRMIAGKGPNAFYCKIGNPFYIDSPNSHFHTTWNDPRYLRIFIDYLQGIKEGRYTQEFIDEARTKPLFDILFGCEFPSPDVMDEKGYRPLVLADSLKYGVTPELIKAAMEKARVMAVERGIPFIQPKLGCDIGGGGDANVFTLRWHKLAAVVGTNQSKDTMVNVSEIERLMGEYGVLPEDVNLDDIGIGRGVTDRLIEKGHAVNGVSVGEPSREPETYFNLKAELYWALGLWVKDKETRLDERPEWQQLAWIKYKVSSEKQVKIEPKEDLKKRTHKSPDFAESLMLTFYETPFIGFA
jgi:hypothetical protein